MSYSVLVDISKFIRVFTSMYGSFFSVFPALRIMLPFICPYHVWTFLSYFDLYLINEANFLKYIGYLHLFLCNKLLSFTLFCWVFDFSEFFVTFWKLDFDICLLNIFPHLSFLLPFLDVFALLKFYIFVWSNLFTLSFLILAWYQVHFLNHCLLLPPM